MSLNAHFPARRSLTVAILAGSPFPARVCACALFSIVSPRTWQLSDDVRRVCRLIFVWLFFSLAEETRFVYLTTMFDGAVYTFFSLGHRVALACRCDWIDSQLIGSGLGCYYVQVDGHCANLSCALR